MTMNRPITLEEFIIERESEFPYATGELSQILSSISLASKVVNREISKAGLVDILGAVGTDNVQGEAQQKLDVYANEAFIQAMRNRGEVCGVASEEDDDFIVFNDPINKNSKYVVCMDPLDGSSNIDVNVSVGTIFSIYHRESSVGDPVKLSDFLQPGVTQVAAGYVVYGSSTMLVYTTGHGVNGFTLDPSIGTFCLSHPKMKFPKGGSIYSINEGNAAEFEQGVQDFIQYCKSPDNENGKPFSARYIGSLVSDFHRNLLKGGIYIYPSTEKAPNGKLRLLYECNPLAMIAEQAGGAATNGSERILGLIPTELHQRVPFFVGSQELVEKAMAMLK